MNMYKEIVEQLTETSSVALCRKWRGLEGELAQMERKLIGGADVAAAGAEAVGAGAISQGLPVCVRDGEAWEMAEPFFPKERMIILGGGHVALPVAEFGAKVGFLVTVVDDRLSFANPGRFPMAEQVLCAGFGHAIETLEIRESDYVVIVTRDVYKRQDMPYLTYCVNCRESFAGQEKEAVHILDLLFDLENAGRPAATVTERWANRMTAARELLKNYWHETIEEEEHMDLKVDKELERKLSDSQILVPDMEQVIEACEREGRGAVDPETGRRIGHLKIQNITYWAEYEALSGGGYQLWNGYSHRMNLEGE